MVFIYKTQYLLFYEVESQTQYAPLIVCLNTIFPTEINGDSNASDQRKPALKDATVFTMTSRN